MHHSAEHSRLVVTRQHLRCAHRQPAAYLRRHPRSSASRGVEDAERPLMKVEESLIRDGTRLVGPIPSLISVRAGVWEVTGVVNLAYKVPYREALTKGCGWPWG